MKKINYLIIILVTFFCVNLTCNASTQTYVRTTDNLMLPEDVQFDSSNLNSILNTPAVNANEKIYDFAYLIEDSREAELTNKILEFKKESEMDIVIVTTNDLKGFQLPEYTYNFYDYNDFATNGVTLIIYTGGKSPEIFMGNSGPKDSFIFTTYNEGRINQTLSYIYKNYMQETVSYYDACDKYIDIIAGFYVTDMKKIGGGVTGGSIRWVEISILAIAIAFIVNLLFVLSLGKHKVVSKKGDVLDKKINNSTLVMQQTQDVQSTTPSSN